MTALLNPETTALVLVDLQHSNVGATLLPHSAEQVLRNAARVAAALRGRGATVVYTRVDITQMLRLPADAPFPKPAAAPAPNACDIVPEAGMQSGDFLVTKRQWGALYATELDQLLRRRNIRQVVLGGIATNFGVESTARAAFDRGYELIFIEDAMSGVQAEMHAFSIEKIFPVIGKVRSTEVFLAEL